MANPPFAGDIKESRIISRYDLGKKPNGKWENKLGRDILFIERNLDFLKPGGRMAIVLPQGRFNNSSDKNIRDYIAEKCRILAVVGLHGNTFKPHTGTKTSVLFVQKWNDDPQMGALCPRQDDYKIFFATMRKSGKDNSGEKIYRRILPKEEENLSEKEKDREFLLDPHDHLIVDHDLYNHDDMTEDGIAEAFIEFAKKEKLSFFESSLSVKPFDAEKYERLMDGLEAVEDTFNSVKQQEVRRFEAEFYLAKTGKFLSYYTGEEIIDFVQYGTSKTLNEEGLGYPVLRLNEFETNFIGIPTKYCNLIDEATFRALRLKAGDIVICRTNGNPKLVGKSALVIKDSNFAFASYLFKIRPKKQLINSETLNIYLSSKYGKKEIYKYSMTSNQTNFSPAKFREILVPHFNKNIQNKIFQIVHQAYDFLKRSQDYYQQAEELLLSELGLKDWQPTEKNIAVKSFAESFGKSERLDAEHYQPKYDQLKEKLNKFEKLKIKQIIKYPVSSGATPKAGGDDYTDEQNGISFIRAVDIKNGHVSTDDFIYIKRNIHEGKLKKTKLKKNDVLFSIAGTVGRCGIFEYDFEANINQAIAILRFNENQVRRFYLIMFFNSEIGKIYISKYARPGLQTNLNLTEVSNLEIPLLEQKIQDNLSDSFQKSFDLQQNSKQLLEIAKIGVERAIEENEERSIDWINQQLNHLGIELS